MLRKLTYKTKERVKVIKNLTEDIKRRVSLKIEPPSIFSIPKEYLIFMDIKYYENIAASLLKNKHFYNSIMKFANMRDYLCQKQEKEKKELFKKTQYDPQKVLLWVNSEKNDKNYSEEILKTFTEILYKYNINCFIFDNEYYYVSEEGAYEIDKFLHDSAIEPDIDNFEKFTNYSNVSFEQKFFKKEIPKIYHKIIAMQKTLAEIKSSPNQKIMLIVYKTLSKLHENHLNLFIRNVLTILYKTYLSNKKKENKNYETIKVNNIEYTKLDVSYAQIIIEFGKMFLKSYNDTLFAKENYEKNPMLNLLIEDIFHMTIALTAENTLLSPNFEIYCKEVINALKVKSGKISEFDRPTTNLNIKIIQQIEKVLLKDIKKLNFPLRSKFIEEIILFYYNYMSSDTWKGDKKDFKIKVMSHFVNKQMVKIHSIIGEEIIKLIDAFIYSNKKDNNSLYINTEGYWTTSTSGKYPFFGTKQLTYHELEEKTNEFSLKFIYNNLAYMHYQPMINYNPKYNIKEKEIFKQDFMDQIQNSSNNYVCKVNFGPFSHFLEALYRFTRENKEYDEIFIKYILPKETELDMLKSCLNEEEFIKVITFIYDLDKLSYTEFVKDTKIYGIKDFITACISHKLEFIEVIKISWFVMNFICWYPRVWSDARGRQYPYETPLNITKSPKWRSLFFYITHLQDSNETRTYLIDKKTTINTFLSEINEKIKILKIKNKEYFNKK